MPEQRVGEMTEQGLGETVKQEEVERIGGFREP